MRFRTLSRGAERVSGRKEPVSNAGDRPRCRPRVIRSEAEVWSNHTDVLPGREDRLGIPENN